MLQCVAVPVAVCVAVWCHFMSYQNSTFHAADCQCPCPACSKLQGIAVRCVVLQCVTVCCSVLRYIAVCCIMEETLLLFIEGNKRGKRADELQCVAVCCSMSQYVEIP